MLSLETCKRLRASGLKQGVSMMLWCPNEVAKPVSRETCAGGGYCDVYCGAYCIEYDDAVDCYNSDELDEAKRQQWPGCKLSSFEHHSNCQLHGEPLVVYIAHIDIGDRTVETSSQMSFVDARADLYITLSAQGD